MKGKETWARLLRHILKQDYLVSKILKRYILAQFWVSQQLDKKLYVKLPQILLQV